MSVDVGVGPPIVVIPGVQGRWEWMRPTIEALALRYRVLTFSLSAAEGLDDFVAHIDRALDRASIAAATVCGVSFGGRVALRYAAARATRVDALVLASTPGPRWTPDARVRDYLRWPWLSTPLFVARSYGRLWPEIRAAHDSRSAAAAFLVRHGARVFAAPMSPRAMAERVGFINAVDAARDASLVSRPALVVTGEPALDRVIDVEDSRRFGDLIRGARVAMLERTGHIGMITRPREFARLVGEFIAKAERAH